MKEEYSAFLDAFTQFRKLHMSSIFPHMNHSEFATMVGISRLSKMCFKTGEQVKVSMLVEELNVNSTAVSRSLKILEEKGYIERIVSKKDRRITYVKLTDAGAEELMKAEKKMDEFAEAVLSNLEEGSLAQLTEIMNQLYNSAVQEINKRKCIQKGEEKE